MRKLGIVLVLLVLALGGGWMFANTLMTHLLDLPAAANDGDYDAVKGMLKPDAQ